MYPNAPPLPWKLDVIKGKGTNGQTLSRFLWHEACLGVLLLPPGWDASACRVTPQQYVASTHLYTRVKRGKVE